MIILQVSPEFTPGTGVGGVAHALETQWLAMGHDVRRFGLEEAGLSALQGASSGMVGRVRHAARVLLFSTVGTVRARRVIRGLPQGAVTICHNDALVGDVYVNHGILTASMKARGGYHWRMVRNPVHLFTAARDAFRYRAPVHEVVVSLSEADRRTLVQEHGLDPARAVVIPNGVHLSRFKPATDEERQTARRSFGIRAGARVAVFVGHEFSRKGLPLILEAVAELPDHEVIVVGGTPEQIHAQRHGLPLDVQARTHWMGRVPDPTVALSAADVLVLPSAYEANPLVVLEALASGLQIVATPVGSVPDMLKDDTVSRVVPRTSAGVRDGLRALAAVGTPESRDAAVTKAKNVTWESVAASYLELFETLVTQRTGAR